MTNRTAGVGGAVRGVGDFTDFLSDVVNAGTTIGQTVLTGNAPGSTPAPAPAPAPKPATTSSDTWKWVGIAGLGGLLLFMVMKRKSRGR